MIKIKLVKGVILMDKKRIFLWGIMIVLGLMLTSCAGYYSGYGYYNYPYYDYGYGYPYGYYGYGHEWREHHEWGEHHEGGFGHEGGEHHDRH